MAPSPLVLYTRAACHLCDDARSIIETLLAERRRAGLPAPTVEERDIEQNENWQRAYHASIPVIELGGRRLDLATSAARIRRLLADGLDTAAPPAARVSD